MAFLLGWSSMALDNFFVILHYICGMTNDTIVVSGIPFTLHFLSLAPNVDLFDALSVQISRVWWLLGGPCPLIWRSYSL